MPLAPQSQRLDGRSPFVHLHAVHPPRTPEPREDEGGMVVASIAVCSIVAAIVAFFAGFALAQVIR